jgi:hypothetical protein
LLPETGSSHDVTELNACSGELNLSFSHFPYQDSSLTKTFRSSFAGIVAVGDSTPASSLTSSSWLSSWGLATQTKSPSQSSPSSQPLASQVILYYCNGLVDSFKVDSSTFASPSSVGVLGCVYLTQSYIGIHVRHSVMSTVKELYRFSDLLEIKLIDRKTHQLENSIDDSSIGEKSTPITENTNSLPSHSAPPVSSSSTNSVLSSVQYTLGLSHLSVSCQLVFQYLSASNSTSQHVVTVTPGLISAEKLLAIIREIKDMEKGVIPGP